MIVLSTIVALIIQLISSSLCCSNIFSKELRLLNTACSNWPRESVFLVISTNQSSPPPPPDPVELARDHLAVCSYIAVFECPVLRNCSGVVDLPAGARGGSGTLILMLGQDSGEDDVPDIMNSHIWFVPDNLFQQWHKLRLDSQVYSQYSQTLEVQF